MRELAYKNGSHCRLPPRFYVKHQERCVLETSGCDPFLPFWSYIANFILFLFYVHRSPSSPVRSRLIGELSVEKVRILHSAVTSCTYSRFYRRCIWPRLAWLHFPAGYTYTPNFTVPIDWWRLHHKQEWSENRTITDKLITNSIGGPCVGGSGWRLGRRLCSFTHEF